MELLFLLMDRMEFWAAGRQRGNSKGAKFVKRGWRAKADVQCGMTRVTVTVAVPHLFGYELKT